METKTLKNMPTTLQAWFMVIRPRTLPIPTASVLGGIALAYATTGFINWMLALFTWFVSLFVTMGTNVINDVFDYARGGDTSKRIGHQKVIQAGYLKKRDVYIGGLIFFGLAALCAMPLTLHAGWGIFFIVALSIISGYCYTGGPYPISYNGLSEIFILVFYGGVCVIAPFYLQTGFIDIRAALLALQFGCLAILPNALNNFRDIFDDAEFGKRTLAVRYGRLFARTEIAVLTFLPFCLNLSWLLYGAVEAALLPMLLMPMAFLFVHSVWKTEPSPIFNRYFALCVMIFLGFAILWTVGIYAQ